MPQPEALAERSQKPPEEELARKEQKLPVRVLYAAVVWPQEKARLVIRPQAPR